MIFNLILIILIIKLFFSRNLISSSVVPEITALGTKITSIFLNIKLYFLSYFLVLFCEFSQESWNIRPYVHIKESAGNEIYFICLTNQFKIKSIFFIDLLCVSEHEIMCNEINNPFFADFLLLPYVSWSTSISTKYKALWRFDLSSGMKIDWLIDWWIDGLLLLG